jgi:hypothetical protein
MTLYDIKTISQIDNKNIKIGKTFKYGDNYHLTNIYYIDSNNNILHINEKEAKRQDAVDEKTKLIIQTPLMYIPNSMVYFNEKPFLELSFNNEENDSDVSDFRKWILALEEVICKLIKKRTSLGCTRENINSVLKPGNGRVSTKLLVPVSLNISRCILNDDNKRNKILFNWDIPVPTYGISIIWIKNIWVKKGRWGLNLFTYATRVMNSHILDPVDFLGADNDTKSIKTNDIINKFHKDEKMSILVGQVPEYTMYFKMLRLGIPKDAVKQKMILVGADSRVLDYPESAPYASVLHYISNPHLTYTISNSNTISLLSGIPPPPPPPPLPIIISNIPLIGQSRSGLLNEISKGGFKLKKIDLEEVEHQKKEKILSKLEKTSGLLGSKVPSLGDIQGALAKLKKVDIDITNDK